MEVWEIFIILSYQGITKSIYSTARVLLYMKLSYINSFFNLRLSIMTIEPKNKE